MTDLHLHHQPAGADTAADAPHPGRRFRPSSRRRNRIAVGVALAAVAVAGNLLVYAALDDTEPVVQVVRDVPAGAEITADMLRAVDVDVDGTVAVIAGSQLPTVVGQHAKVRLVAGSLVTRGALQTDPLVAQGSSVVAIQVAEGALPIGLRERAPVSLVLPDTEPDNHPKADLDPAAAAGPATIGGRVVGLPTAPSTSVGTMSVSIEVDADDAATVAAADDVRIVLVQPRTDPAAVES